MAQDKQADQSAAGAQLLALQNGLQGRFAGSFCVVQTGVDAMRRYLAVTLNPEQRTQTDRILDELEKNVAYLERLSSNAAELALGCALSRGDRLEPLELCSYLPQLCACINAELAGRGRAACVELTAEGGAPACWCRADTALVDGIFVNLLSNSLNAAGAQAHITVCVGARSLVYRDDGPGLREPEYRALLEDGRVTEHAARTGGLGLMLAHEYARRMGWRLQLLEDSGFALRMELPPFDAAQAVAQLKSPEGERRWRQERLAKRVRAELDGVLGPAPE